MPTLARITYLIRTTLQERRSRKRLLASGVGRGEIAIDCGANVGEITALLRRSGATVHAFEPNPFAFDALRRRFTGDAGTKCNQNAVSDREETVKLFLHVQSAQNPVEWSVGSSMLSQKANVNPNDFVEVPAVDLGAFVLSLEAPVKLVKIDIEGMECRVLKRLIDCGAIDLIEHVFVETHDARIPELRDETEELRGIIRDRGWSEKIDLTWV